MAASRKTSAKDEKPKTKQDSSTKKESTRVKTAKPDDEAKAKTASSANAEASASAEASAKNDGDTTTYEVVTPPTPIDRPKSSGFGTFLLFVLVIGMVGVGTYLTWPRWSPYVAAYVPMLEYKPAPDPNLAKLSIRIEALEEDAKNLSNAQNTIAEMEKERARLQDGVKSLLGRLDQMEAAVDNVKQLIAATGVGVDNEEAKKSFERIAKRLAELEKSGGNVETLAERIAQIESVTKTSGAKGADEAIKQAEAARLRLNDAVNNIEDRLNKFETSRSEKAPASSDGPTSATILAISQLRKTVLSGQPYMKDMEALEVVSGEDQGMKAAMLVLKKSAGSGVLTVPDLRDRFSRSAGAIVTASTALQGDGWLEQAANRVRSYVSVRRVDGSAAEATVDAVVSSAEDSLKAGDLAGAVKKVEGLEDLSVPAARVAAPWLALAKARLSAERSITGLHVYAVTLVAASKE